MSKKFLKSKLNEFKKDLLKDNDEILDVSLPKISFTKFKSRNFFILDVGIFKISKIRSDENLKILNFINSFFHFPVASMKNLSLRSIVIDYEPIYDLLSSHENSSGFKIDLVKKSKERGTNYYNSTAFVPNFEKLLERLKSPHAEDSEKREIIEFFNEYKFFLKISKTFKNETSTPPSNKIKIIHDGSERLEIQIVGNSLSFSYVLPDPIKFYFLRNFI